MTEDARTFLERILDHKRGEVARQQAKIPISQLEKQIAQRPAARDFAGALRIPGRTALIAEVKKASPSRGVLIDPFDPLAIARTYAASGASALSILTDQRFFQGSLKYLEGIRDLDLKATGAYPNAAQPPAVPLLRKDFILDRYQLYEARAYGADAVLLIVAALEDHVMAALLAETQELGMQALIEVHSVAELTRALAVGATLIGVNNRDLHSFATSLATTQQVSAYLSQEERPVLVSESGIFTADHVAQVRAWGADAILVGEALVTAPDIAAKVRELASIETLKH
jgi:indole-3-glycerol phosphate synthase